MCYLEGTEDEIVNVNDSGVQCHCYNTNYMGDPDTAKVARPVKPVHINPYDILKRVEMLEKKVKELEGNKIS